MRKYVSMPGKWGRPFIGRMPKTSCNNTASRKEEGISRKVLENAPEKGCQKTFRRCGFDSAKGVLGSGASRRCLERPVGEYHPPPGMRATGARQFLDQIPFRG